MFFFEKKNQKTFSLARQVRNPPPTVIAGRTCGKATQHYCTAGQSLARHNVPGTRSHAIKKLYALFENRKI